MDIEEVTEQISNILDEARMCGIDVTTIIYLDNDTQIEAWYDNDYDCFCWSNGNVGHELLYEVVDEIVEYLFEYELEVKGIEEVRM